MEHRKPSQLERRTGLARDVEQFLASGGRVDFIPTPPYPAPRKTKPPKATQSYSQYRHSDVLADADTWRPVKGFESLYRINRHGEVWSIYKRALLPVTVCSRKVRLQLPDGNFIRVCVDDLAAGIFDSGKA